MMLNHLEEIQEHDMHSYMFSLGFPFLFPVCPQKSQYLRPISSLEWYLSLMNFSVGVCGVTMYMIDIFCLSGNFCRLSLHAISLALQWLFSITQTSLSTVHICKTCPLLASLNCLLGTSSYWHGLTRYTFRTLSICNGKRDGMDPWRISVSGFQGAKLDLLAKAVDADFTLFPWVRLCRCLCVVSRRWRPWKWLQIC